MKFKDAAINIDFYLSSALVKGKSGRIRESKSLFFADHEERIAILSEELIELRLLPGNHVLLNSRSNEILLNQVRVPTEKHDHALECFHSFVRHIVHFRLFKLMAIVTVEALLLELDLQLEIIEADLECWEADHRRKERVVVAKKVEYKNVHPKVFKVSQLFGGVVPLPKAAEA